MSSDFVKYEELSELVCKLIASEQKVVILLTQTKGLLKKRLLHNYYFIDLYFCVFVLTIKLLYD